MKYNELNEFVMSCVKYRKTIMFDIILMIVFYIFNINFITWIGIVYYIIISIAEGILTVIAFISGIDDDINGKKLDKEAWALFIPKMLNEISSVFMIFFLFSILK